MDYAVIAVSPSQAVSLNVAGRRYEAIANAAGRAEFDEIAIDATGQTTLVATAGEQSTVTEFRVIPAWVSVLPAAVAIVVALTLRNVIPALLLGLWLGATALQSFTLKGAGLGLLDSFQVFVRGALADSDRASIILFTLMIGGMVGIITRNGGMASIVLAIVSRARSAIGGQLAVWLMGSDDLL